MSTDMNKYVHALQKNPRNITSLTSLIEYMKNDLRERYAEYGAPNFEKADKTAMSKEEFEALLTLRQSKGLEIHKLLNEHNCNAMIMPAHCHNPSDLGQCPVLCVPLGFDSDQRVIEYSDGDLISKEPYTP